MRGIDLESIIRTAIPRERSGSRTVARFGYQANVGILKLLELAEGGNDFRLVFDLFDDLVVLNSADAPTEIRLYQVKSKDPGEWEMVDLCKKVGKTSPRSYVSRLYSHLEMFGPSVAETGFISNAPYRVQLGDGARTSGERHYIGGHELHADEVTKITTAVLADFNPASVPAWLSKLVLIRTTLGVHGQELVIKGRLYEHFEKLVQVEGINITAVYETLHASIEHRTGFHQEGLDEPDVFARKSLTRAEFIELLNRASQRRRGFLSDWDTIRADLDKEGYGSRRIIKLKTLAIQYQQDRQSGQPQATRLNQHLGSWTASNRALIDACDTICSLANLFRSGLPEDFGYSELALESALIVEAYEVSDDET